MVIEELIAINESLSKQVQDLQQDHETLAKENLWLREQLEATLNRLYGRKSERFDPNQLSLFSSLSQDPTSPQEPPEEEKSAPPKRKGHGRRKFPKHLPRDVQRCTLTADEQHCPECGERMKEIGQEACERGHVIPPRILVRRFEKIKYGCPQGHAIKVAQAPPGLIDRCKYEPSVYAYVAVSKYCDHIPLTRMAGIFKRYGLDLPKSTMWDMLVRVHEIAADPILAQMRKELLEEPILEVDETPVTVLIKGQKGSEQGYVWTWRRNHKILFQFTRSRSRDGPREFLGSWVGKLVSDGFVVYYSISKENGLVCVGCWAHARRKIHEAVKVGTFAAEPLLRLMNRLFRLESAVTNRAKAQDLSEAQTLALRRDVRARRSTSLIDRIKTEAQKLRASRSSLEKSKLGKALTYLDNQWSPLTQFLDDPRLPIHNNASEQSIRHVVIGRNNWQFLGSPRGGEVAVALYSLFYSCKAIGLDPAAYLEGVLIGVSQTADVGELTPWAWAKSHPEHLIEKPHVLGVGAAS